MSTKKLIEEGYDMRPQSKPDASVRGRLLKWENSDYVAFEPQKARETPARTVLKEKKGDASTRTRVRRKIRSHCT